MAPLSIESCSWNQTLAYYLYYNMHRNRNDQKKNIFTKARFLNLFKFPIQIKLGAGIPVRGKNLLLEMWRYTKPSWTRLPAQQPESPVKPDGPNSRRATMEAIERKSSVCVCGVNILPMQHSKIKNTHTQT